MKRKKWAQRTVGQYHSRIKASFLPLTGSFEESCFGYNREKLLVTPNPHPHHLCTSLVPTTMAHAGYSMLRKPPAAFFRDEVLLFPPQMSLAGSLPLFQGNEHRLGAFKHLMTSVAESRQATL